MKRFIPFLLLLVLAVTACRTEKPITPAPKPLTGEWLYYPNDGTTAILKCDPYAALVKWTDDPFHMYGYAVLQFNTQQQNAAWGYPNYQHQFSLYYKLGYSEVYPCNFTIAGNTCTIKAIDHNGSIRNYYLYKL